jgi:hypothetical protein
VTPISAYTPNEGSCCGGINQTNNQVIVKNLKTGKGSVVFDESGRSNPAGVAGTWKGDAHWVGWTIGPVEDISPLGVDQ